MEKTWKAEKIHYIKFVYGKNAERYSKEMEVDGKRNDRQVYVNIYNQIMGALETMPEEPNLYVACALNERIHQDTEMLKDINLRFTGKEF